jgi:hypothetical protein
MMHDSSFNGLTDDQLHAEVQRLAASEQHATAILLRALIELDARQLYLREGCSSLFTYCTQVLHLEEGAAYNRIAVVRVARRLPMLLDAIGDGSITVTSARLLAPHLTVENHVELLTRARHRCKRDVEVLVARLVPRPAGPTVLRKMPARPPTIMPAPVVAHTSAPALAPTKMTTVPARVVPPAPSAAHPGDDAPVLRGPVRHTVVAPLSADTYKLQVTISAATEEKLRRARGLLRHAVPDGDFADVLDRALTLLIDDLEKRRYAAAVTPREAQPSAGHSRHIPAAVKRGVMRRDQGRCAFSNGSRRCTEMAFLEFHHVLPYAHGGAATVRNIELRCRAHNQYEATLLFGDGSEFVKEMTMHW